MYGKGEQQASLVCFKLQVLTYSSLERVVIHVAGDGVVYLPYLGGCESEITANRVLKFVVKSCLHFCFSI